VCDNSCGFGITSIASNGSTVAANLNLEISGTGFGPNAQVWIGGLQSQSVVRGGATAIAAVPPPAVPLNQLVSVVVVNPEGCQSQENATVTVLPAAVGCGLTGVEPFALLGGLMVLRRWRRPNG